MYAVKVILIVIEILCGLLLICVVLLQKTKGEGLGMAFGAEMGESLFGARAGNVLFKTTVWLGIIFMVNTVILARVFTTSRLNMGNVPRAPIEERRSQPVLPALPMSPPLADPAQPVPSMPQTIAPETPVVEPEFPSSAD